MKKLSGFGLLYVRCSGTDYSTDIDIITNLTNLFNRNTPEPKLSGLEKTVAMIILLHTK